MFGKEQDCRIQYSVDTEDSEAEAAALGVKKGDTVMVITGAGGRVFPYILMYPKTIHAVDINPCQQHLFELKLEGVRRLEHAEYLELMGVYENNTVWGVARKNNCWERYLQIRPHLSPQAGAYFDEHPKVIRKGPIYAGRLEKLLREFGFWAGVIIPSKRRKLFEFTDLEEQRRFVEEELKGTFWDGFCKTILFNPFLLRMFAADEAFGKYRTPDCPVTKSIRDRMYDALQKRPARENHVLAFLYFYRYERGTVPPVYLREDGFYKLKEALQSVEIVFQTHDIADVCQSLPEAGVDHASISDIGDYMTPEVFATYVETVARVLRPGGRLCWKYFLSNYMLPQEVGRFFVPDTPAEEKLEKEDLGFAYLSHILQRI